MNAVPFIKCREGKMEDKLEVVFLPCPAMGHFVPTVELAKQLDRRCFSATLLVIPNLIPSWAASIKAFIDTAVSSGVDVRFEYLPCIDPPYQQNQKGETFITRTIEAYRPAVKDALLRHPSSSALVLDWFCTSMIEVAQGLGIPSYIYFTTNAAFLCFMLYLPTLHTKPSPPDDGDLSCLNIPGLPPVPPHYMLPAARDRSDEVYEVVLEHGHKLRYAKGFIVNTFAELEPEALQALASFECLPDHPTTPPVLTVGPLLAIKKASIPGHDHECIKWLDRQPPASVVFLCFGSMGCFERAQVKDMAMGLERSGQRFLWALRCALSESSDGRFRLATDADLEEVLPEQFLERTEGRGMVWPSWVPQAEVLAHPAVGGFVTHCGWNSVLESIWFGVPMLAWPLYADQHMNCLQMVGDLGVAIELKLEYCKNGDQFVSSEEMERGVRSLMGEDCEEGRKVRTRVKELSVEAMRALEEGGSSHVALKRFIGELAVTTEMK